MTRKLSEQDATRYYQQIDYKGYEDVARSKKGSSSVNLTGGKPSTSQPPKTT